MDVPDLDPVIHQPTRFRIMLLMHRNRQAKATWVMQVLGLSDGNLRSHAEKLADAGYLELRRTLSRDGFQVRLRLTPVGDGAFRAYLAALESLLRDASASALGALAELEDAR